MAFNPFESFRKNSKALFAVMMIVCMFTFILSSGMNGGDFFDWLGRQFGEGGRGPSKEEVATYFGKPITRTELENIRRGRVAANMFIFKAVHLAGRNRMRQLENDVKNQKGISDPDTVKALSQFFKAQSQEEAFTKDTTTAERNAVEDQMRTALRSIQELEGKLDEKTKPDDTKAIKKLMSILQNDLRYQQAGQFGGLYFRGIPNNTDQDALDFELLLRKADQMGLKYTDDQIASLIALETENSLSDKDAAQVETEVRQAVKGTNRSLSGSDLLRAIGNEYRVRSMTAIARGDRFSAEEQLTARPMAMSPWDFYRYYRDRCSEISFRVIDIPVEAFLTDVKEEPTTQEQKNLFKEYANTEAKPDSDKFGFKQPNRAMFEYIGFDNKSPFYEKIDPLTQAVSAVAAGMTPTVIGGGPFAASMHIVQPILAAQLPLEDKVAAKVKEAQSKGFPSTSGFPFPGFPRPDAVRFRDNTLYHPLPFAALASQLAFPANIATLSGAAGNQYAMMFALDAQDRLKAGLPAFLAGYGWGNLPATNVPTYPLGVLLPAAAGIEAPIFAEVYRREIKEKDRKDHRESIVRNDRDGFIQQLRELGAKIVYPRAEAPATEENTEKRKKADAAKAELNKFIADFAAARGLKVYRGKKLDDRFDVRDDPDMKPLIEAAAESRQLYFTQTTQDMTLPPGFDELEKLFVVPEGTAVLYNAIRFPQYDDQGISAVVENKTEKPYLVWRIEDVPAKAYRKWDDLPQDMKDRVIRAWKMQRARDLAKKQAETLADDLRSWAGAELRKNDILSPLYPDHPFQKKLLDVVKQQEGEQHKTYRAFTLENFAKLKKQPAIGNNSSAAMGGTGQYLPMGIPAKEVRYPTEKMAEKFLAVRDKPVGETIVLNDAPQSHYYVACLIQKKEKDPAGFLSSVFLRSSIPQEVKIRYETERMRSQDMLRRLMQNPQSRQNAAMIIPFLQQQAMAVLAPYDLLMFDTALSETLVPEYNKEFIERLKAEGNFKGNEELLKTLAGKERAEE